MTEATGTKEPPRKETESPVFGSTKITAEGGKRYRPRHPKGERDLAEHTTFEGEGKTVTLTDPKTGESRRYTIDQRGSIQYFVNEKGSPMGCSGHSFEIVSIPSLQKGSRERQYALLEQTGAFKHFVALPNQEDPEFRTLYIPSGSFHDVYYTQTSKGQKLEVNIGAKTTDITPMLKS